MRGRGEWSYVCLAVTEWLASCHVGGELKSQRTLVPPLPAWPRPAHFFASRSHLLHSCNALLANLTALSSAPFYHPPPPQRPAAHPAVGSSARRGAQQRAGAAGGGRGAGEAAGGAGAGCAAVGQAAAAAVEACNLLCCCDLGGRVTAYRRAIVSLGSAANRRSHECPLPCKQAWHCYKALVPQRQRTWVGQVVAKMKAGREEGSAGASQKS